MRKKCDHVKQSKRERERGWVQYHRCFVGVPIWEHAATERALSEELWPVWVQTGVQWPGRVDLPDHDQIHGGSHTAHGR